MRKRQTRTWEAGSAAVRGAARVGSPLALTVVIAGALAMDARPATAQAPRVITFEEAVDLALEGNTDLLRARTDVDLRGTLETRARMDFLPELSVATRGRRSFGRSFSQEEGEVLSESNDFLDGGLSARIELFNGLERWASLREASLAEEASRLRLDRTREDVLFRVVQGFTTLVLDRELTRVREEELVAAGELLSQVRRLVDLGRQPASDLYQQEAALAEAEAALVDARREEQLAETALLRVLSLDPLGRYEFQVPELPAPRPDGDAYDLDALLSQAFARRADLAALERGVAASGQGVTAARSGYWPSLSLSFDYGSNWSSTSLQPVPGTGSDPETVTLIPEAGGDPVTLEVPGSGAPPAFRRPDFMEQLSDRRGGSVSLSLSVPLFDRLQTRAAVEQAEVAERAARYDLQDQRQTVALQVRQALLDYRSARARQSATSRRLAAAERGWDAAERRYELGAATFVEVAQARSSLVAARSADLQARYEVLLAQRLIAYHTGGLDTEAALFTETGEAPDDA
jgi:outer membrane protein